MEMQDWLAEGAVADAPPLAGKRQALAAIADLAARAYAVSAPEAAQALAEREAEGSTGFGHGIALPHAQIPGLDGLKAVFLRLQAPVDFGAVDGEPVDLLLALFAPPGAETEHLRALARVSRLLRRPEVREGLRQSRSPDALRALLVADAQPRAA